MVEVMNGIDVNRFMHISGCLFIATPYNDESNMVQPCKIKMGSRRFLEIDLNTDKAKIIIWNDINKENPYICQRIKFNLSNGIHNFDLTKLLKELKIDSNPIKSLSDYQSEKKYLKKNTMMVSESGFCEWHSIWMDCWMYYMNAYYKPGFLIIQGYNISKISSNHDFSLEIRELIQKSLETKHEIGVQKTKEIIDRKYTDCGFCSLFHHDNSLTLLLNTKSGRIIELTWEYIERVRAENEALLSDFLEEQSESN